MTTRKLWVGTIAAGLLVITGGCGDDDEGGSAGAGATAGSAGIGGSGGGTAGTGGGVGGTGGGTAGTGGGTAGTGGGSAGTGGGRAGAGGGAGACTAFDNEASAFVTANKTCLRPDDCVQVSAPCSSAQEDCCVVYMNQNYDATEWTDIYSRLEACLGNGCGCCAAIPAPPSCNSGVCGPAGGP